MLVVQLHVESECLGRGLCNKLREQKSAECNIDAGCCLLGIQLRASAFLLGLAITSPTSVGSAV